MTQPEGVSFTVGRRDLRWHRWTFVPSIDPQEGLVLHDVRFDDRPVLYRGSCPEMVVPYGEPIRCTTGARTSTPGSTASEPA